ncbi:MAG: hypothetical protein F4Y46_01435 [Chloroflexi bacterium]|nr:hypothetical protein [Chloroflexota bacterium]
MWVCILQLPCGFRTGSRTGVANSSYETNDLPYSSAAAPPRRSPAGRRTQAIAAIICTEQENQEHSAMAPASATDKPPTPVRIVVPGDFPPQIQGSPHLELLDGYGDVKIYRDLPADVADLVARSRGAEVIINTRSSVAWPAAALRRLPELRLIATCSIGVDMIDLAAARDCGVAVCNLPGRTAPVVAEHAVALMYAAARRLAEQTAAIRSGEWPSGHSVSLRGKTVGIVGTGNIGADFARVCNALGMRCIAWTFNPDPERAKRLGVRYVEFDQLLAEADVVSLHLRLSPQSQGLIGPREFGLMKPGALFVNVSRGGLVDEAALVDALRSGHLAGAGLDVFEPEPPLPDNPLLACQNVVFSPHVADMTPEGADLLNEGAVENVIAFLQGRAQNRVA